MLDPFKREGVRCVMKQEGLRGEKRKKRGKKKRKKRKSWIPGNRKLVPFFPKTKTKTKKAKHTHKKSTEIIRMIFFL